eukprot:749516-Hanusia_phi.AAC.1
MWRYGLQFDCCLVLCLNPYVVGEKVGDENEGEEEEEVEEEEEEEEYQDGESSPYASPRGSTSVTSEEGQDHSSDPANDGSSTKSMARCFASRTSKKSKVKEIGISSDLYDFLLRLFFSLPPSQQNLKMFEKPTTLRLSTQGWNKRIGEENWVPLPIR